MDDDDKLMTEVQGIVKKQRELAEKHGTESAKYKAFMEKADEKMAEFDKKNEEVVASLAKAEIEAVELKERIKTLEALGAVSSATSVDSAVIKAENNEVMNALLKNNWGEFIASDGAEKKAARLFNSMVKMGDLSLVEGDVKKMASFLGNYASKSSTDLLRSDIGELGGFLCPPEWSNELNKNIIEYSPVRNFVRVKRTASKVYKEPIRVGIPKATRPGETRSGGKSVSQYAMNDFSPERMTNTIGVTYDELLYNAYDLASELMRDNAEAFAVKEGEEFFSGSGVKEGLGWSVDPNVPEYITAVSGVLDFDDMIGITGELKRGYNPMYSFNRRTLAYLRTIKDSSGRYLWNPAFGDAASGAPATVNGYRYSSEFIEYDDHDTNGGFPVLFADMMRFYQIVDRTDMTVIRDEYTQKVEGIVEFTMNKWCTGKTKIQEAGIRMKVKA